MKITICCCYERTTGIEREGHNPRAGLFDLVDSLAGDIGATEDPRLLQRPSTQGRFRVPLVQDPRGEREAEGRVEDEWLGRGRGVGGREEVGCMRE